MAGEYQISEMLRKLNRLEAQIKLQLSHMRVLRGAQTNIEARMLLETVNNFGRAAVELEDYLLHIVGEAQSAVRRFPAPHSFRARSLAQQQALNQGFASAVGYRNELKALVRRLPDEMHTLLGELQRLAREANVRLNDPGRYGDAAASIPINDLLSFVFGALDAVGRFVEKTRQSALQRGA